MAANTSVEVLDEVLPPNKKEQTRLKALEGIIHKSLKAIFEVGAALAEIRDTKLYRTSHVTFEAYVQDAFEMGRTRAYQLIDG